MYGGTSNFQTRETRDGFRACTYGLTIGIDYPMGDGFLIGFLMGYEHSSFDMRHGRGDGDMESFRFGPYASKQFGAWYVNASLTAGLHWIDYTRQVPFAPPFIKNKGNYQACDVNLSATVGHDFQVTDSILLSPYGTLSYTYLNQTSFRESGFVPTATRYDSTQDTALTSFLGVRGRYAGEIFGTAMALNLNAAWAHRCFFGDETQAPFHAVSGFQMGPQQNLGSSSRNYFVYGANVVLPLTESTSLTAGYNGRFGSDHVTHFGTVAVRIAL